MPFEKLKSVGKVVRNTCTNNDDLYVKIKIHIDGDTRYEIFHIRPYSTEIWFIENGPCSTMSTALLKMVKSKLLVYHLGANLSPFHIWS